MEVFKRGWPEGQVWFNCPKCRSKGPIFTQPILDKKAEAAVFWVRLAEGDQDDDAPVVPSDAFDVYFFC